MITKWWPEICSTPKDCRVMAIERRKVKKLMKIILWLVNGNWVFSDIAKNGAIFSRS